MECHSAEAILVTTFVLMLSLVSRIARLLLVAKGFYDIAGQQAARGDRGWGWGGGGGG